MRGMMQVLATVVQMDCQSVCLYNLSLHHKIHKMASNNAEVDKGCSEFCITVGTVNRTASILSTVEGTSC